ncbi:peptide chain release factor N(5)-glutamine methyltransferase [endosymbiont GvMRE of Glomus versiforme]|uniref:peptide chain release factor N(5)-glutamine methyltransferase n=1 Tax=endosymbiont GvMRE of Glomus versiforme TaxID=2039283 RepID=UPI000EE3197B|nr:peptide chain release factor N(5)-glutamine methyltransferase [endosymbiont GvMRE of Glomus versiforme]RHZ36262.1 Release factor glutamine methyltransferase [endosymbiont GvMRE of Glomus versiforme]
MTFMNKKFSEKSKRYSYNDCWNYAFQRKKISVEAKRQKEIISICQTIPAEFWLNFSNKILTSTNYRQICQKIQQYQKNTSLAYLNKETYFYNLPFKIEKGVFIPQKDTEILLEKTVELINQYWKKSKRIKILDIGTGCGNLAICLAKISPQWQITAIDISKKALKVAQKNVQLHQAKNVKIKKSNLFHELVKNKKTVNQQQTERYNIIITNPPYISEREYKKLHFSTKQQPKKALVAKNDGYWFYEKIIQQVQQHLTKKFLLIMEVGHQQKEKVLKILIRKLPQAKVKVFLDLAGKERVIAAYKVW